MYNVQCTIKIAVAVILVLIFSSVIIPVYAQANGFMAARISPASPLYFLTSIREILELKFADTTQVRSVRELEFTIRRMKEVKSLVNTSHQDLIEPALKQYFFHLKELTGIVNLIDKQLVTQVVEAVVQHMDFLQTAYSQVSQPRARLSIRAAINSLTEWDQELADRLVSRQPSLVPVLINSKLSGCRFLSQEASSSSLNEAERSIFAGRAKKCLESSGSGRLRL